MGNGDKLGSVNTVRSFGKLHQKMPFAFLNILARIFFSPSNFSSEDLAMKKHSVLGLLLSVFVMFLTVACGGGGGGGSSPASTTSDTGTHTSTSVSISPTDTLTLNKNPGFNTFACASLACTVTGSGYKAGATIQNSKDGIIWTALVPGQTVTINADGTFSYSYQLTTPNVFELTYVRQVDVLGNASAATSLSIAY